MNWVTSLKVSSTDCHASPNSRVPEGVFAERESDRTNRLSPTEDEDLSRLLEAVRPTWREMLAYPCRHASPTCRNSSSS